MRREAGESRCELPFIEFDWEEAGVNRGGVLDPILS